MGGVCPNASENGQIIPRPPSGLPEVTVAVRIALLPCRETGKPRISKPFPGSSGESRLRVLTGRKMLCLRHRKKYIQCYRLPTIQYARCRGKLITMRPIYINGTFCSNGTVYISL